jgi:hypothetical protein
LGNSFKHPLQQFNPTSNGSSVSYSASLTFINDASHQSAVVLAPSMPTRQANQLASEDTQVTPFVFRDLVQIGLTNSMQSIPIAIPFEEDVLGIMA